ncbi:MAG: hypothetical protein S4CHLAM81_02870 [Chlamydiales bacterium]|nr:hypothetical protein [Chlamydiales bacterium]MCH9635078.1 hypothetical protein [Chlamydiales bacterium]
MKCRVCDQEDLSLAIDLGKQPWGNHFLQKEEVGKEPFYPLEVHYCHSCATAQLNYTVKKEVMFADTTYLSGTTRTLSSHFKEIAGTIDTLFFKDQQAKSALDIGSNDGTQLSHYKDLGYKTVGVESSKRVADIANQNGIETVNGFFNLALAKELNCHFDVINAAGVFFHLEELHSVCEAIKALLKSGGVFVCQFLYMKSIMENCAFDQIYHEHLLYYTLETLNTLLKRHDLEIFDAFMSDIHGGSMIAMISHPDAHPKTKRYQQLLQEESDANCNSYDSYVDLANRAKKMKEENLAFLEGKRGKRIYGMGAPCKGNTLLNYFGIGTDHLDCLVEKNAFRKGLYSPGMHIPIWLEDEMPAPDVYYVLAWNFKKEILKNNQHLKETEFYFPIDL